ncbi:hypothetical protein DM793_03175 [Paenarthrobacter nitroguajacolicus]|nr:hypothetical protein [Paenarthrobacter nitroguajacolicus]
MNMDLHLQQDWQRVLGQHVEVRRQGKTIRTGTVEAVMPDSSILWVSAAGAYNRELVERVDGIEIYAHYPCDSRPLVSESLATEPE